MHGFARSTTVAIFHIPGNRFLRSGPDGGEGGGGGGEGGGGALQKGQFFLYPHVPIPPKTSVRPPRKLPRDETRMRAHRNVYERGGAQASWAAAGSLPRAGVTEGDGGREGRGACDGPGRTGGDSSVTNAGDDRTEKCVRCVSVPKGAAVTSGVMTAGA